MKEYIQFELIERKPKTNVYLVRNIVHGSDLGRILWYGGWRQYIFEPGQSTVWSHDCLKKIEEFLLTLNER